MTYRNNFDNLGNPVREKRSPWRLVDLIAIAFCVGMVAALVSGVFA